MNKNQTNKPLNQKEAYTAPSLTNYGRIASLTQTKSGGTGDNPNNTNSQAPPSGTG